jgi:predicted nucleic acid-binding Zn ribbon protein
MPTYVYKFVKTGETIEVQQSFDEAALTQAVHPRSGRKMAVKKVFTPVGVTFKGGGFYKTDSRGKASSATTSSTSSTTPSSNGDSGDIDVVRHVELIEVVRHHVELVEVVGQHVEHDALTSRRVTPR